MKLSHYRNIVEKNGIWHSFDKTCEIVEFHDHSVVNEYSNGESIGHLSKRKIIYFWNFHMYIWDKINYLEND